MSNALDSANSGCVAKWSEQFEWEHHRLKDMADKCEEAPGKQPKKYFYFQSAHDYRNMTNKATTFY